VVAASSSAAVAVVVVLVPSQGRQFQQQFIVSHVLQFHFPFQLANPRLFWKFELMRIEGGWCWARQKRANLKRLDVLRMLCPLHFRVLVAGQQSQLGLGRPQLIDRLSMLFFQFLFLLGRFSHLLPGHKYKK
jgi:hypothetical protein